MLRNSAVLRSHLFPCVPIPNDFSFGVAGERTMAVTTSTKIDGSVVETMQLTERDPIASLDGTAMGPRNWRSWASDDLRLWTGLGSAMRGVSAQTTVITVSSCM